MLKLFFQINNVDIGISFHENKNQNNNNFNYYYVYHKNCQYFWHNIF